MGFSPIFNKINNQSHRVVEACVINLFQQNVQTPNANSTHQERIDFLARFIEEKDLNQTDKNSYLSELISKAKHQLLPIEKFNWIKNDERACYWVFGNIILGYQSHYIKNMLSDAPSPSNLGFTETYTNHKERFDALVRYIDIYNLYDFSHEKKSILLDLLKRKWGEMHCRRKPFTWLKKENTDQCRWAWEYIKSYEIYPEHQGLKTISSYLPLAYNYNPLDKNEMYFSIYAAFDLWETHADTKTVFLNKFNKAWHQKKLRDSREGKKVCNLVLSEEVKNKLDKMAENKNMKINKFVEMLIENEFEKY